MFLGYKGQKPFSKAWFGLTPENLVYYLFVSKKQPLYGMYISKTKVMEHVDMKNKRKPCI